ncbi:bifunctional transcriptional activator/DNA repair enzyme AdaA [Limnobacter litoralis]|uniref:Methylated-DNA--protein-cysteine methyltransferase n=1 Tax=Limnobacter litoralis TaxID=481366 RepID=A0ABQ5YS50_9BURK|nr:methylated-DNA--[protein]-cysteine S-methyltransferase [Limnobacter litoralis]GLR26272.1 methylated-DNA--protein-cysteine methyltransferase [Limnobacter litoralis]
MNSHHYDLILAAINLIDKNPRIRLDELALKMGYSPFHLQRVFKDWAGVTPQQFSRVLRKNHAIQLLDQGQTPQQASLQIGYESQSTLNQLTVQLEAMTPSEISQKGHGLTIRICELPTPFGKAFVACTDKGICNLEFETQALTSEVWLAQLQSTYPNAQYRAMGLTECPIQPDYFNTLGNRPSHQIKLHVRGTAFQIKVWEALLKIPTGELRSYSQIAHELMQPRAQRAVGSAVASNQVAVLIPCHRVIQSTGNLGQYRWGAPRKKALHAKEFLSAHPGED